MKIKIVCILIFILNTSYINSQDTNKIFFASKLVVLSDNLQYVHQNYDELKEELDYNECEILSSEGFNNNLHFILVKRRVRKLIKHFLLVQFADSTKIFSSWNISSLSDKNVNDSLYKYFKYTDSTSNQELEQNLRKNSNYYSDGVPSGDYVLAYDEIRDEFFRLKGFKENDKRNFYRLLLLQESLDRELIPDIQKLKDWKSHYKEGKLPEAILNRLKIGNTTMKEFWLIGK